jgi:hypothetical protein
MEEDVLRKNFLRNECQGGVELQRTHGQEDRPSKRQGPETWISEPQLGWLWKTR